MNDIRIILVIWKIQSNVDLMVSTVLQKQSNANECIRLFIEYTGLYYLSHCWVILAISRKTSNVYTYLDYHSYNWRVQQRFRRICAPLLLSLFSTHTAWLTREWKRLSWSRSLCVCYFKRNASILSNRWIHMKKHTSPKLWWRWAILVCPSGYLVLTQPCSAQVLNSFASSKSVGKFCEV